MHLSSPHLDCNLTKISLPLKVGSCREAVHRRQATKGQASRESSREVSKVGVGKVEVDKVEVAKVDVEMSRVVRGESVRDATRGGGVKGVRVEPYEFARRASFSFYNISCSLSSLSRLFQCFPSFHQNGGGHYYPRIECHSAQRSGRSRN